MSERNNYAVRRNDLKTKKRINLKQVFISHADEDKKDAECLKNWLFASYTGIDVFLSSANGIHCGENPSKALEGAMGEADVLIALLTPMSMNKPWIVFETGAVCGRRKKVLPLLCKGAKDVTAVPDPMRTMFQVNVVSRNNDFQDFLNELGTAIGDRHKQDAQSLRRRLMKKGTYENSIGTVPAASTPFCRTTADVIEIKLHDGELPQSTTLRDVLPSEIRSIYETYTGIDITFQVALAHCGSFRRENPKLYNVIRDANFWTLHDHMVKAVKKPRLAPIFSRPLVEIYRNLNQECK